MWIIFRKRWFFFISFVVAYNLKCKRFLRFVICHLTLNLFYRSSSSSSIIRIPCETIAITKSRWHVKQCCWSVFVGLIRYSTTTKIENRFCIRIFSSSSHTCYMSLICWMFMRNQSDHTQCSTFLEFVDFHRRKKMQQQQQSIQLLCQVQFDIVADCSNKNGCIKTFTDRRQHIGKKNNNKKKK